MPAGRAESSSSGASEGLLDARRLKYAGVSSSRPSRCSSTPFYRKSATQSIINAARSRA